MRFDMLHCKRNPFSVHPVNFLLYPGPHLSEPINDARVVHMRCAGPTHTFEKTEKSCEIRTLDGALHFTLDLHRAEIPRIGPNSPS